MGYATAGRGDPAPAPQLAPLRAGVARCGGGGRASPGGGAFHRCAGRLRSGAPPPPTARPLGGPLGSATHVLWARVCGCGGPTLSPWRACPVGAACRGGGGEPSPGGLACHRCEGRLVSGAVPPPAAHPLERAARVPRPVCPGCGRCGCGDPAPAPRRAPLRAGVARRGGGGRASPGGVPSAVVRGVWGQALPLPRLPALWAGCRGPLPTGCGCGGVRAWGPVTNPTARALASWLCALLGRHEGPPGGAPPAWVWGVRGRALSHPRLHALWAGCRGPLPTGCGCGGVRAWGPVTSPTARALACCGGGMRVPGGGASCLGVGRPGSGALPPPTARPLGGLPGPTTHWLWVRGGAGVGTRHQPNSARSCELALRAVGAARGPPGGGGGASCLGVGRPGSGALPRPTARHLGGLPGPTTHSLWVRGGAGVGTRHQPHSARSCELALRTVGAARGPPGGGGLLPGCGASGVGRSPTPDCPPSGRAAGAHYPLAVGAGGCGRGDPSPTPQRAL